MAEGLYALFETQSPELEFQNRLGQATESYWESFIHARAADLERTTSRLATAIDQSESELEVHQRTAAIACMKAAERTLSQFTPDLCVDFMEAWREDLSTWSKSSQGLNSVGGTREALDYLGLSANILVVDDYRSVA